MVKTIYVGNLPFSSNSNDVGDMFAPYGAVHSVNLINDRETGRPRGFGFVEMDDEPALAAIEALNGKEIGGRSLRINEARGREDRGGGGGDRGERRPRRNEY